MALVFFIRRPFFERPAVVHAGQVLLLIALFVLWEGAVITGWIHANKGGQPSRMWDYFAQSLASGELWLHPPFGLISAARRPNIPLEP